MTLGRHTGQRIDCAQPCAGLLRLLFTFYQDATELGTQVVEVAAPATGESVDFDALFSMRANGFRYELAADS